MIKAIIFLEGGQTNATTYNNNSFEEIFNDYDRMLGSKTDFLCIGNDKNKSIINKNKIISIKITEQSND